MKSKLILASRSFARQQMLRHAGYDFDIIPANIDEENIMENSKESIENISTVLAKEKAKHISSKFTQDYIIGSDQILYMNNQIYSKEKNSDEAKERLSDFQGKTHVLNSAVSAYKNGEELFSCRDEASLTMKPMSVQDINQYCNRAGDVLTSCVGCYALEGLGIRLFQEIKGDYFTILGMPLLPLIQFLDGEGFQI